MAHLFVSWADYHRLVERLAGAIHDSDWRFDHIVCIGRSGLHIGDLMARLYRAPLAVLQARSRRAGEVVLSELAMLEPQLGARVLLVDDLVDTGATLSSAMSKLRTQCKQLRSAALWVREGAGCRPDYYVAEIERDCDVHHPVEQYELSNIAEVARRRRSDS